MSIPVISMQSIYKTYPNGFTANSDVNFSVNNSEIHALIGENGAGKSTLMKILFGMEQPTKGSILLNGKETKILSPNAAIDKGIGMVHQHFMLIPSLSVAENLVLGMEPHTLGKFNKNKAVEITNEICNKYGFKLNPNDKVMDLSVASKQKLEILKTLIRGCKTIILDEPTAVLTSQETDELFIELRKLKNSGHNIIFISHKLREVKAITDRITVMRAGKVVKTCNTTDVSVEEISNMMVGSNSGYNVKKSKANPKDVVVNASNLVFINNFKQKKLDGVSFSVRSGEILGIAGVEGNGQDEIYEIISNMQKNYNGIVEFNKINIQNLSIREYRNQGVGMVHADRFLYGIAPDASIADNLISDRYFKNDFSSSYILKIKNIISLADVLIKKFVIKCSSKFQAIAGLSGGNIQKVVISREFSSNPKFLILNQPTRGVDIGSASFIYEKIIEMRDKGVAVLLISADLSELMALSDSILVMHNGKVSAYFKDTKTITEEDLGYYMLGVKHQKAEEIREAVYV